MDIVISYFKEGIFHLSVCVFSDIFGLNREKPFINLIHRQECVQNSQCKSKNRQDDLFDFESNDKGIKEQVSSLKVRQIDEQAYSEEDNTNFKEFDKVDGEFRTIRNSPCSSSEHSILRNQLILYPFTLSIQ